MLVKRFNIVLLWSCTALLAFSCTPSTPDNTEAPDAKVVADEPVPVRTNADESAVNQYRIEENSIYGLLSGVPLADRMERLEKGTLSSGEGDFDVYYIKGVDGEQLGYVLPHTRDESLIGSITITTPQAKTADGIGIGQTFGDLQTQTADIQVYGSEIEARTHAVRGREMFLLDAYKTNYEVDEQEIEPATKIKQITIMQHQAG
jgi:hypothetical protein